MEPDQRLIIAERDHENDKQQQNNSESESIKCDDTNKTESLPLNDQFVEKKNKKDDIKNEQIVKDEEKANKCDTVFHVKNNTTNSNRNNNNNNNNANDSTDKKSESELENQCSEKNSNENNNNSDDVKENVVKNETTSVVKNEEKQNERTSEDKSYYESKINASFNMKAVPGSNDVKIEIDSSSLLDKIILHTLKNTVVDNSRLNAAKNKYIMNNGSVTNNSSNGSDSNSSSKSVEKLIEEFKGNCQKSNITQNNTLNMSVNEQQQQQKSDNNNSEINNGADRNLYCSVQKETSKDGEKNASQMNNIENNQTTIPSAIHETKSLDTNTVTSLSSLNVPHNKNNAENEALDFRDPSSSSKNVVDDKIAPAVAVAMLDLSLKRDEKSVPPIKRSHSHALYVGLPDFSKQIFTAPSITRTTNTLSIQGAKQQQQSSVQSTSIAVPKVRNPDFSTVTRAPELQMRHPDFSKGFAKSESPQPTSSQQQQQQQQQQSSVPITPSNFPEIARKNNYISDLQLKPPPTNSPVAASASYKIDYRPPVVSHQNATTAAPQASCSKNQEQLVDEPMAHVIHKNHFVPMTTAKDSINRNSHWNEQQQQQQQHFRGERLLGGCSSSHYEMSHVERKVQDQMHESSTFLPNDDLRKVHPAHYQYKDREQQQQQQQQQSNEFSLKQKEQQLRQEGTIITIKNENSARTPTNEHIERRSADLFRDYKLKQPKESPDVLRRTNEPPPLIYQYPDFPPSHTRKLSENANVKMNTHSPGPQVNHHHHPIVDYNNQQVMGHYQASSPIHRQQKSPSAQGQISNVMNPPQNWPPPLVPQQQLSSRRQTISPAAGGSSVMSSPSPTHYQYYHPGSSKPALSSTQSISPIPNYNYQPAPPPPPHKISHPQFKYPEQSTNTRHVEVKNVQNLAPSTSMPSSSHGENYYHQKYPDFTRRFDGKRSNYSPHESHIKYSNSPNFVPIESKPTFHETIQHNLPIRHDLEIRTIREQQQPLPPENRNMNYRQQPTSSYYVQRQERDQNLIKVPMQPHDVRENLAESSSHYLRIGSNDPPRIPPDLKIERRSEENLHKLCPPIIRNDHIPELSIIPKVKTEPPSTTPVQHDAQLQSSIIKSTKSLFAEVKRESPLDLSVKTVKTKADSTGCDTDFQLRHRKDSKIGLKVDFLPNFSNVAKTDCRQQARLGPQDFNAERIPNAIPVQVRSSREHEIARGSTTPNNNLHHHRSIAPSNQYNEQKPVAFIDRPATHANYYPERKDHLVSDASRAYETQRYASNYPENENHARNSNRMSNIPYPVISKAPHQSQDNTRMAAAQQQAPTMNTKDPLYLERERDRKYVENILYGRSRKEANQFTHDPKHYQSNPSSPPRKRHLDMMSQKPQTFDVVPHKQSRIEEPPKMFTNDPPFHINHHYPYDAREQKVDTTPPVFIANEHYPSRMHYVQSTREGESSSSSSNVTTKHYPLPRKDVIKSAEIMSHQNKNNLVPSTSSYYPNPKAEMIHRSDPKLNHLKYYPKEIDRNNSYMPPTNQNFHRRPDDAMFPMMHSKLPHPVQEIVGIKIEQQQLASGPISQNNLGEHREQQQFPQRHLNGTLLPSSMSGSNGSISRGADQSTIQKLKSNLEFKEMQKMKIHSVESEKQQLQIMTVNTHQLQHPKKNLSPRQFRTKGELKGYIPMPIEKPTIPKTSTDSPIVQSSSFDLLDWGSACNDFVQQLQTGKKRMKKRRSFNVKNEKTDEKSLPGTTVNDLSEIPKEIIQSINRDERNSSSDEDKPLLQLKMSKSQNSMNENLPEKLSRNFREKQRHEIEQKIAARLGRPSSSESETDTRKISSGIKRVRRLRKRAALGIKKTDDERSAEEGETDGISLKIISKMDELTSSDDERKKKSTSDKSDVKKSNETDSKRSKSKRNEDASDSSSSSSDSEASSSSSSSAAESETTEDKINKLSSAKNVKRLKDLGDSSNIKTLLQEEETMTRSKRKLEIEKKLSNSKILRNEKVVQNITPDKKAKQQQETCTKKSPPKRKDSTKSEDSKRKIPESESEKSSLKKKQRKSSHVENSSSSSDEESKNEEEEETKFEERLRPRKKPDIEISKSDKNKKIKNEKEETAEEKTLKAPDYKEGRRSLSAFYPFREDKTSKFTPGWETETYHFKRTLKVPPGLITIGRPPQHGISHSLPDLDPQTSDTSEIFSEFVKSKDRESAKGKTLTSKNASNKNVKKSQLEKQPSSIIDLLHQRVVQSKRKFKTKKAANLGNTSAKNSNSNDNNDDLLPTPEKESEKVFGFKKNIFEPFIITSARTRTENNAIRKKEILKEVFGADERPRSAPPNTTKIQAKEDEEEEEEVETVKKVSFDQKYLEYLEKMNADFLAERKTLKLDALRANTLIKEEEVDFDCNEMTIVERELVTPTLKGKVKKNRQRRCKGSSGFDYIRKKKKPVQHSSEKSGPLSSANIIKKRLAALESLETKDENDISKEIKGWVLNKGVGESVLHKASRLDYVDVVAYCLDRMNMSPDPKDNAGYTPLFEACSRGHLEIARLLLQYGANHSESALSGIRPLHEAIENGHIEIVRLLLSFGADPCLATYSGQLPIAMAEDKDMENFLKSYLIDIDHEKGVKTSWLIDGAYKIEDPDEIGYDIFDNVPIMKTDLGSSVASVLSTSMTSLITATTQMSDNETVISETAAISIPSKISTTPMRAPSQDFIKYQHKIKLKCDTNSNNLLMSDANSTEINKNNFNLHKRTRNCSVLLNNIDSALKKNSSFKKLTTMKSSKLDDIQNTKEDYDDMIIDENMESDCDFLEVEESEIPLPPLYLLRDEGTDKWVLLTDLCNLLKVKSKDAVLKQICPSNPPSVVNKNELIRELKMSDFLEKAMCLQLFCAGEKINVRASKVSLVRYNESVKNLLGVQTIRMNM